MKRLAGYLLVMLGGLAQAAGFDATVQFARRAELAVPVSGVVQEVSAAAGAHVSRGQALLKLDDTPFRAAVEHAEAEQARAAALHTEAARDHRHAKELYDRTLISTVELENAKLRMDRAAADLRQARARLTQARWSLGQCTLSAPFDAWVVDVRATPGMSVASALETRVLVVLAQEGEYIARTRVSGEVIAALRLGQPAAVKVGGQRYEGQVRSIALEPTTGKGDGQYELAVGFHAPQARLHAGHPARIELP